VASGGGGGERRRNGSACLDTVSIELNYSLYGFWRVAACLLGGTESSVMSLYATVMQ